MRLTEVMVKGLDVPLPPLRGIASRITAAARAPARPVAMLPGWEVPQS